MSLPEKKETKPILKKHVNTIHCSNNLTLVQRKLFNALLFNAYHDMPDKSKYQVPVKKLCSLIGYDSRDYKKLRKSILDLITTAIEWNVIDQADGEQKDKWRASAIVSAAKIEDGICTYEFSSVMRELLHTPEIYGKIDIKLMIQFKSSYGLALYENCIRFQGIAQTQWFSVNVFRKLMGIPDGYYQNFCDLKKRVLDIAVKEVNEHSPINVIPELKRVNKKVTSIRFKLSNKDTSLTNGLDAKVDILGVHIVNILRAEFNLSTEALTDILQNYEVDYIEEKVNLIKQSESFKIGKIRDLAAYLAGALKRDYQPGKSSQIALAESRKEFESRELEERRRQDENIKTTVKKQRKKVDKYLSEISEEDRDNLMKKFENYIKETDSFYTYKKYKEMGMDSPAVQAMFTSFVTDLINAT